MKVLVVGAGIYGLTTALHLALDGHEVEVLDQGPIPNPDSSSYDHHRLIRHAYGSQSGYARIIPHAYGAWDRLWSELNASFYTLTGCLAFGLKTDNWIAHSRRSLQELEIHYEVWDAPKVRSSYPWLTMSEEEEALFTPQGGILESGLILNALCKRLTELGVTLRAQVTVVSVDLTTASVRDCSHTSYSADFLVLALGAGHGSFFPDEITAYRQVYALFETLPPLATVEESCPMVLDISDEGGFYYVPGSGSFPAKIGDHVARFQGRLGVREPVSDREKATITSVMASRLSTTWNVPVSTYGWCTYSCTSDLSIRYEQGPKYAKIYGGSGHGFKFGALFGELLAGSINGRRSKEEVSEMISGRFAG